MAYVGRSPPKLHLTTSVLATPEKSSITILLMIIFKSFFFFILEAFYCIIGKQGSSPAIRQGSEPR